MSTTTTSIWKKNGFSLKTKFFFFVSGIAMYNKRSKSGYRQPKANLHVKTANLKGYPATLVVPFEVEELGNTHILQEASKVLQWESNLEAVKRSRKAKAGAQK